MKYILLGCCLLCLGEVAYLSSFKTQGRLTMVQEQGCYSLKDFKKGECK